MMEDKLPTTKEALLELRLEIQGDIDRINGQLADARRAAASDGDYSDADWYRRAETALRHKGRLMQRIQLELTRLRGKQSNKLESAFIEAARELLLPDVFQNIMDAAHERLEAS